MVLDGIVQDIVDPSQFPPPVLGPMGQQSFYLKCNRDCQKIRIQISFSPIYSNRNVCRHSVIGQIICTLNFFCDVQIGKRRSEKNWLGDNGMENSQHVFCHFRTAREDCDHKLLSPGDFHRTSTNSLFHSCLPLDCRIEHSFWQEK